MRRIYRDPKTGWLVVPVRDHVLQRDDDLLEVPCRDCGRYTEQTVEDHDDGTEPICEECGAEIEAENQRLDWAEERRKGDDY